MIKSHLKPLSIFLLLILAFLAAFEPIIAQGGGGWAPANPIPFYENYFPPYLLADSNRTVHAFNEDPINNRGDKGIFYRKWTLDNGWTPPIDVILPNPTIGSPLQGVTLDKAGIFHIVFYGGSIEGGDIYYVWAPATIADRATSWSDPVIIGEEALPLPSAELIGDGRETLFLIFDGVKDGLGIYEVNSFDSGATWSKQTTIYIENRKDLFIDHINLLLDNAGTLHAVWSILNSRGLGEEVWYAHREATSGGWSTPYRLAAKEGNDYAADWASLTKYEDEIFAIYMDGSKPNGVPPTLWMRRSSDNGATWGPPDRPFPHVGEYGSPVLLTDSSGTLHLIMASRVGEPAVGGMWHSTWLGNSWSEPELITARTSQEALASGAYLDGGGASRPIGVIVQGNVLLATWWHNNPEPPPAAFSYKILNSPESPVVQLPQPMTTPVQAITTTPTISAEVTASIPLADSLLINDGTSQTASNPGLPVLWGSLAALLVIFLATLIHRLFIKRNG